MNYHYLIIYLSIVLTSCANKDNEEPAPSITIEGDRFSFVLNDGLQQSIIPSIQGKLDENYSRVLADLDVAAMNKVQVSIWGDRTNFYDNMRSTTGTIFYGAAGWIPNKQEVRIFYVGNSTAQVVLHEFCHAVSLNVNSTIGNNPRWLWEAVAIYEAGEFINPKTINYIVNGVYPTLAELNSDYNTGNNKIYNVGYLLAEYIIAIWGKSSFVNLIKSNGNIEQTLEISTQQFEVGWKNFVIEKYFN